MKHRGWSAVRGGRKGAQLALGLGLVLLGTAALPLHAQDGADSASQQQTALRRVRLDIPAQPLNRALLRFAEQAGVQVFFDSQRFAGLGSAAVHGEYVLADGLSQMLQGSPVEYRFSGKDQLSLIRVSQDDLVQMSPSVISAARPDDWVYQTPHSVSVIGREQIERNPPRHAADMLEETPGVYSSVSQQDPGLSVNIRGIQDYGRVNMSVDGMRQNYQQSGHQQRNGTLYVDPELLSEVVIDKGASSAMGGAGVIGGIANFRTLEARDQVRPGKQVGGRVRLTSGLGGDANGTHFIGSAAFAIGTEVWDMLVAASERHLGDYDPGTKGSIGELRTGAWFNPEAGQRVKHSPVAYSGYVMRSRLAKLGVALPQEQRLQFSYLTTQVSYDDANMLNTENQALWEKLGSSDVRAQNFAIDYGYAPDNPLVDFKAKLYYVDNRNRQQTLQRGITPGYSITYQTDTYGAQAQNTSTFALDDLSTLRANYGLEFFYDKVRPDSSQPRASTSAVGFPAAEGMTPKGDRALGSLFARLDYDYDDWLNLNAGLRYDRYRLRGDTGFNARTFILGTTRQTDMPLQYAVAAFTGKERGLVIADPSYDSVVGAAQAQGAKVAAVPLDAEAAHDIERMLAAAQRDAGLIYICNPNNPTGTLTPHERIVRAIERKPERSVVLVDEAYIHFSDAPSVVGLAVQRQDVLVLRTFSKLYGMAGARLGLAIGHPQLLARLERFGGHNVVPSPTAHAGLESLRDDDLVPRRKQQNAEVRERTIAWLRQQGFRCTASQSNCFMVDMRRPAELVIAELEKQRVHVGRPWASWPNWVRVTVGSEEEMQAFRSAFASVSRRHQVAMR